MTEMVKRFWALAGSVLLVTFFAGCERTESPKPAEPPRLVAQGPVDAADTIYAGGTIVTIADAEPTAEAVAVKDGRILAVGTLAEVLARHEGEATRRVDLGGRTLLPGFIDGHSHIGHAIQVVSWANLSIPPVGSVDSIAALIDALKQHASRIGAAPGDWIVGWGYDQDGLEEARHVTRDDLDPAFPDNPVLLLHVSGHGVVLNSRALAAVGIDASTPTPEGGVIARMPGSEEPTGLLMETAMMPALQAMPRKGPEEQLAGLDAVQALYAQNGYTTIQDGASDPSVLALLRDAAARERLLLDVVALPVAMDAASAASLFEQRYGTYEGRLKLGGVKLLTDGSPQGRTAYFSEPYLTGGLSGEADWRGKPFIPEADYEAVVAKLYAAGIPVWTHANGDAAVDMVIRAHELAGAKAADDRRDVVIHSQFVRPDQLDSYARLGLGASFFSNHAFYWGDVHVTNLGQERAFFLSPLKSAAERGIRYSNHTDYIVTPLDPMMTVWTAVTRTSRSGVVIGPAERVSPLQALRALTIDAAWLYREENRKGSIEPGKLADFVVLDANPLGVDADALRGIKVVATIKEDKPVFGAI